jgi:hypothetical protein
MNTLRTGAITAEATVLGATAAVAWDLVRNSGDMRITAPVVLAVTALASMLAS